MTRSLVVCLAAVVALAGLGFAQEEETEEFDLGAALVAQVSGAEALWEPSEELLSVSLLAGIAAASAEIDFLALPAVAKMTWQSGEGTALAEERSLRFAALMTPQLTGQIVGYAAAWEEETWEAIQEDVAAVAADLTSGLLTSLSGGPRHFLVAVRGAEYGDILAAVYQAGQWRKLEVQPWGPLADYSAEAIGQPMTDSLWAAKYLLAQEASYPALQPAEEVRAYLCTWSPRSQQAPDGDFMAELPQPDWSGDDYARLAVGSADLFGWVDFDLTP